MSGHSKADSYPGLSAQGVTAGNAHYRDPWAHAFGARPHAHQQPRVRRSQTTTADQSGHPGPETRQGTTSRKFNKALKIYQPVKFS